MRLLIFDFDGIVIDTETPDYDSWQEVFHAYGRHLPLDAWADCIGARAGVFDPCAYLEQSLGRKVDQRAINEARHRRYVELVAAEPLRPGLILYLKDAKRAGMKIAVASSASREWVAGHLNRFNLLEAFDCIKTVEDVAHAKPAPDLFQAVLEATGVPADETVAFEDSSNGIRAAKDAGIWVVAVPNPVTCRLPLDGADLTMASFEEIPLQECLRRLKPEKSV